MSNERATEDAFNELHRLTADALIGMLKAAGAGRLVDTAGEVTMIPPALLGQAIKFLSENGIDRPATGIKKTDTLKKDMPDFDELQNNVVAIRR